MEINNINYERLLVEKRRVETLKEQHVRRQRAHDEQRPTNLPVGHKFRCKRSAPPRTLKEIYGLELELQLSEWMLWPPSDFAQWQMVPCPCGLRCLVVAHHGRTELYHKSGRRIKTFHTKLPGDGLAQTTLTALDCIYDIKHDKFYVLDALYFGTQELLYCTAEFRYFWLKSQFQDMPELQELSKFELLTRYDCENAEMLQAMLMRYPHFQENTVKLDGYLFYHKEGHYKFGYTPLVSWLFAFMIPDVLGYSVNENYVKPKRYETPMQFVAQFEAKIAKKACRRLARMDAQSDKSKKNVRKRAATEQLLEEADEEEAEAEEELEQDVEQMLAEHDDNNANDLLET